MRTYRFPSGSLGKESIFNALDAGDACSIPRSGRCLWGGNGNPLRYSCLESPVDRGAWQAIVHVAAEESDMTKQLKTRTTHSEKLLYSTGFPGGSVVKNLPASSEGTGNMGLIPTLGRFCWRRKWQLALLFLPRESYGQRSLVLGSVHRITKSRAQLSD